MEHNTSTMPEADKQITDLIHDIRNPLTAIRLAHQQINEEISRDGETNPSTLEVLNAIIIRNLEKIEQHLIKLNKLPEAPPSRYSKYDISRIIEAALKKASDRIFLAGMIVQQNYMPGHFVHCNLDALTNAFANIIVNAVEAVEPGKGHLWITAYEISGRIKVVFKDNGHGIDPTIKGQIFDPQFSLKEGGLGMGLTIVKQVLEDHNAQLSLMSEKGNGTTVMITFP
jgi:signal transduction histidine kinase